MVALEESLAAELEAISESRLQLPPYRFDPLKDDPRTKRERQPKWWESREFRDEVLELRCNELTGRYAGTWLSWLFPGWVVWLVASFSIDSENSEFNAGRWPILKR